MDLTVRVEVSDIGVWDFGGRFGDVAEAEDQIGLFFGPGGVARGGLRVRAVLGCVGGGHGVVVVSVVFGMHLGGFGHGGRAVGRHGWKFGVMVI